jgi:acetyl-CoA acetyltransferase
MIANAAVVGVAELAPARDTGTATDLSLSALVAADAAADAGLPLSRVDGLLTHPMDSASRFVPSTLAEYLGLRPRYVESVDLGGASAVGMVWRAAAAIAAGRCRACLCITAAARTAGGVAPGPTRRTIDRSPAREFEVPYGNVGPTEGYAMIATRYEHEFGDTAQARAQLAVAQRRNASAHPKAMFRDIPLTEQDVWDSEMIADPLRKLDCVRPAGGAAAVLVVDAATASSLIHPPVYLRGAAEVVSHKSISGAPELARTAGRDCAHAAFTRAGVSPSQVGLASIYDCYTITVLITLEDAGFCEPGQAAKFIATHDLSWSGSFPLNTHGGQLSFGQADVAGGMSHVTEAVLQLQTRAEGRQVTDLRHAFVHGNGGIMSEQASIVLGLAP